MVIMVVSIVHVSRIIRIVKTIECEIVGKSSGANEPRDVLWRLSEVVKEDHSSMSERGYERTLERGSGMTAQRRHQRLQGAHKGT